MAKPKTPCKRCGLRHWGACARPGAPELAAEWGARGLSTRAANVLASSGAQSLADVRALGLRGILMIENCGITTMAEIGQTLFAEDWVAVLRANKQMWMAS